MANIVGPPANSIRNKPITTELNEVLDGAADATGVAKIIIVSGGQVANHLPQLEGVVGGWTGSHRHDNGGAADIQLIKNGTTLAFTDSDGSQVASFVTAAAARGATGIGAGVNYMGPKTIHVGFGNTPSDHQKLVWGAAGASANAPGWLRVAAKAGWDHPVGHAVPAFASEAAGPAGAAFERFVVAAREGLWLRKGPGLGFERARLLAAGTELTVAGRDGDWARVDLEHDGLVDGYVFAAFLKATESEIGETAEEPADAENLLSGEEPRRRPSRRRG
jgi:hypothetical protein